MRSKLKINFYSKPSQLIVDGVIFACSFATAYFIRFEGVPDEDYIGQLLFWLPYLLAARLLVNWHLGVYRLIWRYVSLTDALAIGRSLMVVTGLLLGLRLLYPSWGFLSEHLRIPLSVIALEFLLSFTGCLGGRALRRILYQRRPYRPPLEGKKRKLILVGAGRAGVAVAKEISAMTDRELVGFLDDDPKMNGTRIEGVPVLGPLDSLPRVAVEHEIEEVMICIPGVSRETLKRIWVFCDLLGIPAKTVPTIEEVLNGQVKVTMFRDVRVSDLLGREVIDSPSNGRELAAAYAAKRILITGAGGSIGSELARQLRTLNPQQLILLDKDENGLNDLYLRLRAERAGEDVYPVVADIRFPETLRAIFERCHPEVVFHAAAHKHVPLMEMNPCEVILNNVTGTHHLVEQSVNSGVSRLVLISTDKAVRPVSLMGASKRVCELIVQAYSGRGSTRFSCVRFGNVMGSRGSVVPLFRRQIAQGGPITVTHRDVQRYLMTIPEAVHLVLQTGTLGMAGEIFVLDMGDPITILKLAQDMVELSGLRPDRDIEIAITQLRPGEKLTEELIDRDTESLSPTPFEKIRAVQGLPVDVGTFRQKLDALEEAARRQSAQEIYQILRDLGIGFRPVRTASMSSPEAAYSEPDEPWSPMGEET